jgi:hypothetical protein
MSKLILFVIAAISLNAFALPDWDGNYHCMMNGAPSNDLITIQTIGLKLNVTSSEPYLDKNKVGGGFDCAQPRSFSQFQFMRKYIVSIYETVCDSTSLKRKVTVTAGPALLGETDLTISQPSPQHVDISVTSAKPHPTTETLNCTRD